MLFHIAATALLCGLEAAALNFAPRSIAQLEKNVAVKRDLLKRADVDPSTLYPAYNISVPIDYFHNETRYEPHSNGSFNIRYWFDATYYKAGGPVFVLLGGETDGADRLGFLQKGIVHQVAKATGGVGVILEHRYYGTSFPVPDLTTKNMRFLSTEQALADVDFFARNVKFNGIDADLTAPNTPWIVYGGSYAGAQAAFLRVVYPETFWGGISSSGVTEAIYDYWQYFEPIRLFGPPDCIKNTQILVDVIDKIALGKNTTNEVKALKDAFGVSGITHIADFTNLLGNAMSSWQSTNWDPDLNSPSFFYYCQNITATPTNENSRPAVSSVVASAGYGSDVAAQNIMLNAISWFNTTYLSGWRSSKISQDAYFTSLNATALQSLTSIEDYDYVSWPYQVCTEWAFFQTGNTPADIMPIVSRTVDLDYTTFFCHAQFNITTKPDIEKVNKYGGYNIEYERLAFFGGNADPWRPATPLWFPDSRNSSTDHPWHLISHGVHHWEENGVFENETTPLLPPAQIVYAQQTLKNFVIDWLDEWTDQKTSHYEL